MRIVGIEVAGHQFAGTQLLEVAQLTMVWGVNDAGKTTTLHAAARGLTAAGADRQCVQALQIELDLDVADELAARAIDELVFEETAVVQGAGRTARLDPTRDDGGLMKRAIAAADDRSGLVSWLDLCLHGLGLTSVNARRTVSAAMARRPLLVLTPSHRHYDGTAAWRLWWGIRGDDAVGLDAEAVQSEHGFIGQSGGPHRLLVSAGIGPISGSVLPTPIEVPLDWGSLLGRLGGACRTLSDTARERKATYFEPVHPSAVEIAGRAVQAASALADRHLPAFVSDTYRLHASLGDRGVEIEACRKTDQVRFPAIDLARGFHLWIQLGFVTALEAVEHLASYAAQPDQAGAPRASAQRAEAALELLVEDTWSSSEASDLAALLEAYSRANGLPSPDVGADLALDDLVCLGDRLFIIDEPEAHLHPTAQRQAARWLDDRVRLELGQIVLATHAPAFLSLAGKTRYVHITRDDRFQITVDTADPRDLGILDAAIAKMGFDRGELLALHRVVLFVEGATDRAVLEGLYGQTLRELGVWIQPFFGAGSHRQVMDADVLMRILGPPFHVLVDNLTTPERNRIATLDEEDLTELSRAKTASAEQRFVAGVWLAAAHTKRRVIVHSIPSQDILGVLDDEVVAEILRERRPDCPPYPGFAALVEEAKASNVNYNKRLAEYGVEKTADFFYVVACRMGALGKTSHELDGVLNDIWLHTAT